MVVNFSQQHSLISNWVGELRDTEIQKDRMRFRRNLERIGEAVAYEISKVLPYVEREVQTPLGIATTTNNPFADINAAFREYGLTVCGAD